MKNQDAEGSVISIKYISKLHTTIDEASKDMRMLYLTELPLECNSISKASRLLNVFITQAVSYSLNFLKCQAIFLVQNLVSFETIPLQLTLL